MSKPRNGLEVAGFMDRWCVNCAKDAREDCDICTDAFFGPVEQWVADEMGGHCTEYKGGLLDGVEWRGRG